MNRLQALTRLRSLARKTGLIRVLSRLNRRRSKTYEARFAAALAAAIKPGDRVWDIGANVGYCNLEAYPARGCGDGAAGLSRSERRRGSTRRGRRRQRGVTSTISSEKDRPPSRSARMPRVKRTQGSAIPPWAVAPSRSSSPLSAATPKR